MTVSISMLRGVNVGGHNKVKMDTLRAFYRSLNLRDPQTYIQSGNVVFRTEELNLVALADRIRKGIGQNFGCCPDVMIRTCSELKEVVARNPFANQPGIDPSKLVVIFLSGNPDAESRKAVLKINVDPEELRVGTRELYVYFPNGQGRAKFPAALIEKTLKTSGTGRNWNTVTKLLEIAEGLKI